MLRHEEYDQAKRYMHLWCSETSSFSIHESFRHILNKVTNFHGGRVANGLRSLLQRWMPHLCDFKYCHHCII